MWLGHTCHTVSVDVALPSPRALAGEGTTVLTGRELPGARTPPPDPAEMTGRQRSVGAPAFWVFCGPGGRAWHWKPEDSRETQA